MRTKNASINATVNMLTYVVLLLPIFIVRKVFFDTLGDELLGLVSLYTNIISFLSIMELGIGSAINFSLYKPFAEGNRAKIKAYLDYYKKFYRNVGFAILITGILIIPMLNVFINNEVDIIQARIAFVLFLLNTLVTYFLSHKITLLIVAQENYKVTLSNAISRISIAIIQIIMLKINPNIYIYLGIQLVIQLVYYISLNLYIDKRNQWMKTVQGELEEQEKLSLTKNIKALFLHKIGGFLVLGTDNMIISYFINLSTVALYNNYYMVIYAVQTVVTNLFSGITASIGNLLVDGNSEKAYKTHNNILFFNFWLVSFITISLFNTIDQFIGLWFGERFILDRFTISVLLINFYFYCMRQSLEQFKDSSGNYHQDRFAPIAESIINLIASILLVKVFGLAGVFLGTMISNFSVVFWTKPKVVYKYVFNKKLSLYFKSYFKYLAIGITTLFITSIFTMPFKENISLLSFISNCMVNILVINIFYLLIFYKTEEFNYFMDIAKQFIKKLRFV